MLDEASEEQVVRVTTACRRCGKAWHSWWYPSQGAMADFRACAQCAERQWRRERVGRRKLPN